MTSRILALRRGKNGDVQSFSAARPANPGTAALLRSTLGGGLTPAVRAQILADPGNVTQFAGIFGETAAYLTRPVLTQEVADNTFWFVGNVTDTIGEPCPAKLGMPEFTSHIVTLVRRGDAIALGLAIHPAAPDTLEGRRARGAAAVASLERLNFPMPDNPADDDFPVVAALPAFFPIVGGEVPTFSVWTMPSLSVILPSPLRSGAKAGCTSLVTTTGGLLRKEDRSSTCPSLTSRMVLRTLS